MGAVEESAGGAGNSNALVDEPGETRRTCASDETNINQSIGKNGAVYATGHYRRVPIISSDAAASKCAYTSIGIVNRRTINHPHTPHPIPPIPHRTHTTLHPTIPYRIRNIHTVYPTHQHRTIPVIPGYA